MEAPEVQAKIQILGLRPGEVQLAVIGAGQAGEGWYRVGDIITVHTPVVLTSINSFPQTVSRD